METSDYPGNYIFTLHPSISDISFSEQFFNAVVALASISEILVYTFRGISQEFY